MYCNQYFAKKLAFEKIEMFLYAHWIFIFSKCLLE